MSKLMALVVSSLFVLNVAYAQTPAPMTPSTCEAKAVDKTGKTLSGAARTSFLKKCESDARGDAGANCEAKALSSAGKPLAGAARASFITKCEADAGAGSTSEPGCAAKALSSGGKPLAGAARTSFIKKCQSDAKASQ